MVIFFLNSNSITLCSVNTGDDENLKTYKLSTACMDRNSAGTLMVSKNISAAFSRFRRGFRGASVSSTGCSSEKVDS